MNEHLRKPPKGYPATLAVTAIQAERSMLKDDADKAEEVNLVGLDEWKRFFAWCEVLGAVDETYTFFAPTVEVLREQSRHPDELRQA